MVRPSPPHPRRWRIYRANLAPGGPTEVMLLVISGTPYNVAADHVVAAQLMRAPPVGESLAPTEVGIGGAEIEVGGRWVVDMGEPYSVPWSVFVEEIGALASLTIDAAETAIDRVYDRLPWPV